MSDAGMIVQRYYDMDTGTGGAGLERGRSPQETRDNPQERSYQFLADARQALSDSLLTEAETDTLIGHLLNVQVRSDAGLGPTAGAVGYLNTLKAALERRHSKTS